jgi:hypothetical protein
VIVATSREVNEQNKFLVVVTVKEKIQSFRSLSHLTMNQQEDVDPDCVSDLAQCSGRHSDSSISDEPDVGLSATTGRNVDNGVLVRGTMTATEQQQTSRSPSPQIPQLVGIQAARDPLLAIVGDDAGATTGKHQNEIHDNTAKKRYAISESNAQHGDFKVKNSDNAMGATESVARCNTIEPIGNEMSCHLPYFKSNTDKEGELPIFQALRNYLTVRSDQDDKTQRLLQDYNGKSWKLPVFRVTDSSIWYCAHRQNSSIKIDVPRRVAVWKNSGMDP